MVHSENDRNKALPIFPGNSSLANDSDQLPAADFSHFGTFKKGKKAHNEFKDLDFIKSHAKIGDKIKQVVILSEKRLQFEKAKQFCEFHNAALPRGHFYHKPMKPLQAGVTDQFWVE